jgi:DUF4097 and DUF4098 domain-containing protein YvlB
MKRAAILVPLMLALHACEAAGQEEIDQTIPSSATGQVEITNVSGSIRVIAWDRNEIRVTGTLGRGTERLAVEGGRDRTTIRVVIPQNSRNVRETELEVRVPARKDVTVRGVSASVEVEGVTGGVSASSTSGDVSVTGSPRLVSANSTSGGVELDVNTRTVRAHTTSGDISIAGRVQESVEVNSTSGDVEVTGSVPEVSSETVSGNLSISGVSRRASAATVSGSVSIEDATVQFLSFESVSGELHFSGNLLPGAAVNAESHSGDITLQLPGNTAVDFKLNTFSGDIENQFGPAAQRTSRYSPGRELSFSTGRNGVVAARTFSGTISLERR